MDLVCLKDYEERAAEVLAPWPLNYYRCAAGQMTTRDLNSECYKKLRLRPKCLQDVSKMDISTRIFGCDLNMPIGISPTALQKFAHPEGELANARAAEKAGVVFTMSSFTNTSFKEISDACPKLIKWYQLYIYEDREMTEKMVKTAEATGFKAIVLTVDSPAYGISYAMKRDHPPFRKPKDFCLPNFEGPWSKDARMHTFDKSLTWEGVKWLVQLTSLPVIAKGVLRAEDALKAIEAGCQGIIVSNHGGRNVDTTPATIEVLPEIVEAVQGRVPVIIDGGVRLGTDILKALALGADLVMMGRPALWGLAVNGQAGVENVLEIIRNELETTMMLCGVPTLQHITRDLVAHESEYEDKLRKYLERVQLAESEKDMWKNSNGTKK